VKIISKYKDYYDFVAKIYGEDSKIVFNRKPNELELTVNYAAHEKDFYSGLVQVASYNNKIDPVCNQFKQFEKYEKPPTGYIESFILCGELYITIHKMIDNNYPYKFEQTNLLTIQEYFDNYIRGSTNPWEIRIIAALCNVNDKYINLHKKFNSPVICLKVNSIYPLQHKVQFTALTNVSLLERRFETKIDAYQMFQDIQTFITNHLTPEIVIEKVEDKYKIIQHGFDKQSFRHRK
jgi:hypothetical protein